jgi:cobalt-zinc-cadmium efflux system membrane fusion protein
MTNKKLRETTPMDWRTHNSRKLAGIFLALAMLAPLAACGKKTSEGQPPPTPGNVTLTAEQRQHIGFYTVAPSRYRNSIDATGLVDFDNDQATSVLAPISGPVSRLLVSPGDKVRKGQPLAIVASPDYAAAISTYAKALVTAQNTRKLADADKDLAEHKGVSQRESEQAQTDAANAEADRDAALQALTALNVDPQTIKDIQAGKPARGEGVIRAPLAGTVVEKLISPGQLLQAGTTAAFTVADLSKVWVMVQIFGADLASVKVGDRAVISTGVSHDIMGTVDNISALVNPDTRSVMARVVVDNTGEQLKKSMYVRVVLQSRQENTGIQVPVSAILRDDENLPFVYVTQPDGTFARRHVTLGNRVGDNTLVSEGLNPGDRIVTDGGLFMQFMQTQ